MVDRTDQSIKAMARQLKELGEKPARSVINSANRKGIEVPVARAIDLALSKFQGEGFMASHIVGVKGRSGNKYLIQHKMGIAGGSKKPKDVSNIRRGSYRLSKTPLKRRGTEKRTGFVGFEQGEAYYWRFLEFGTSRKNMHPRPFMRPAWEGSRVKMWTTIVREVRRGMDRHIRRIAKKGLS